MDHPPSARRKIDLKTHEKSGHHSYLSKIKKPEELPDLEGLRLAKRAIKSLKILKDQDFTLILPVCFDQIGEDGEIFLLEMDRLLREELKTLGLQRTLIFSSQHLDQLKK